MSQLTEDGDGPVLTSMAEHYRFFFEEFISKRVPANATVPPSIIALLETCFYCGGTAFAQLQDRHGQHAVLEELRSFFKEATEES